MSRAEYMRCRRRCKKLHAGQVKLAKTVDKVAKEADAGNAAAADYLVELLDLQQTSGDLMELFRLDTWAARRACVKAGTSLPPPHRSEGPGYRGADPAELERVRRDLEARCDTNAEALISQGRA